MKILHQSHASNVVLTDLPVELGKKVKTTDPVVWPILLTTAEIHSALNLPWPTISSQVGMIMYGNSYPKQASEKIIAEIKTKNRVSPLNFINANAGAAISVCCTTYQFRGPTLNLTMSDIETEKIALIIADDWLRKGDANYIFLVKADHDDGGNWVVNNKLLTLQQ